MVKRARLCALCLAFGALLSLTGTVAAQGPLSGVSSLTSEVATSATETVNNTAATATAATEPVKAVAEPAVEKVSPAQSDKPDKEDKDEKGNNSHAADHASTPNAAITVTLPDQASETAKEVTQKTKPVTGEIVDVAPGGDTGVGVSTEIDTPGTPAQDPLVSVDVGASVQQGEDTGTNGGGIELPAVNVQAQAQVDSSNVGLGSQDQQTTVAPAATIDARVQAETGTQAGAVAIDTNVSAGLAGKPGEQPVEPGQPNPQPAPAPVSPPETHNPPAPVNAAPAPGANPGTTSAGGMVAPEPSSMPAVPDGSSVHSPIAGVPSATGSTVVASPSGGTGAAAASSAGSDAPPASEVATFTADDPQATPDQSIAQCLSGAIARGAARLGIMLPELTRLNRRSGLVQRDATTNVSSPSVFKGSALAKRLQASVSQTFSQAIAHASSPQARAPFSGPRANLDELMTGVSGSWSIWNDWRLVSLLIVALAGTGIVFTAANRAKKI